MITDASGAADLPAYDVVIATRNRFDALEISLPLMFGQDPPPRQVIIVDSSDDAGELQQVVERQGPSERTTIRTIRSQPGLPLQRNIGLDAVTAPVVFFADDDAFWHPGFARYILGVYARDEEGKVGGVGGREVPELPTLLIQPRYSKSRSARLNRVITPVRSVLEKRFFPEPLHLAARTLMQQRQLPPWVDGEDIVAVEHVTGFRMTFRTDCVRSVRFDEVMSGYTLADDAEMSLSTLRDHFLLVDHRARVAHYKRPGGREFGWRDGYFHLLHYGYAVAKHSSLGSKARQQLLPWGIYRCMMYGLRVRNPRTLHRFLGAIAGLRALRRLSMAPDQSTVIDIYQRLATVGP